MIKTLLAACMALSVLAAPVAQAADFPQRPIRLLVGFSPGGAVDEMARRLGQAWETHLGQPVVVENRPGAASLIAADLAAKAAPDGHTLFLGGTSTLIAAILQTQAGQALQVDPMKDLLAIGAVAESPLAIAVNPGFPAQDIPGFIDAVRAAPGRYFYATSGVGSLHHLGTELLMQQLGLDMTHVPYKGASQILPDLINGQQIQIGIVSPASTLEQVQSGRIRLVGLLSGPRLEILPDTASFSETVNGFDDAISRMIIFAPAQTSAPIVEALNSSLRAALEDPALVRAFATAGAIPSIRTPDEVGAQLVREHAIWERAAAEVMP